MSYPVLYPIIGDTFPIYFNNEMISGLVSANLKIYKQGIANPRVSTSGYVPLNLRGFDFISVSDIHGFSIDSSNNTEPNFYSVGSWYTIVISGVTSNSTPVHFIAGIFRLMPLASSSSSGGSLPTGLVDVNVKSWNSLPVGSVPLSQPVSGSFSPTGIVDSGTAQSVTATTLVLRSAAKFGNNDLKGATVVIRSATTGAGQSRLIVSNVGVSNTVTIDEWTTLPTGVVVYDIFATPPNYVPVTSPE